MSSDVPRRPTADLPLSEFGLVEEGEDDVAMVAFLFLADAERLRIHVAGYWRDFVDGEIFLVAAAMVNSQAVELVKTLERDVLSTHGRWLGDGLFHQCIIVMLGFPDGSPLQTLQRLGRGRDWDPSCFFPLSTFRALVSFKKLLREYPGFVPGGFGSFNPAADRRKMSATQRTEEETTLLATNLREIALFVSQVDTQTAFDSALHEDTRTFVRRRPTPFPPTYSSTGRAGSKASSPVERI